MSGIQKWKLCCNLYSKLLFGHEALVKLYNLFCYWTIFESLKNPWSYKKSEYVQIFFFFSSLLRTLKMVNLIYYPKVNVINTTSFFFPFCLYVLNSADESVVLNNNQMDFFFLLIGHASFLFCWGASYSSVFNKCAILLGTMKIICMWTSEFFGIKERLLFNCKKMRTHYTGAVFFIILLYFLLLRLQFNESKKNFIRRYRLAL